MEAQEGTSSSEIPVLVTVLSEAGGSNELREELNKALVTLIEEELQELNISFSEMQRFGM